jgi:Cu2+-containing amine oxidase
MNVDIEIYISQLKTFFENNPGDFMDLVGEVQKEEFFQKMKEKSIENYEKGEDFILTKQQIIEVVVDLKSPELNAKSDYINVVKGHIQKTKFGDIILN